MGEANAYRREDALAYAERWALARNPHYMNLNGWGGDCTNFASQCLFAGSGVMNYQRDTGWYYRAPGDRAPAWTGVRFFRRFLLENTGAGPFARKAPLQALQPGDFILLGNGDRFYHTLIVMGFEGNVPLVSGHSFDVHMRPLTDYGEVETLGLAIQGIRAPD